MDNAKNRRTIGLCRLIVVVLVIAVVALAIALGVVASKLKDRELKVNGACKKTSNIDLNPPAHLSPFHDLTPTEVGAVRKFLHQQESLNLVPPSKIAVNSSYVFSFELHVPNKQETLAYLDDGRPQPAREAHVVIFRGDLSPPVSEEYTVGPLPNPTYLKDKKSYPFRYRPLTTPEIVAAITLLYNEISSKANFMLLECYGGKLVDCTDNCLDFEMLTPQSGASVGDPSRRKMWFWLSPAVEFWSLNPLDFRVLVDMTSTDPSEFRIDTIYHANRPFTSVDQLVRDYNDNRFPKTRMNYPKVDNNLFSSIHRRGTLHPTEPMSPPLQYEPDGKRYNIKGRHIDYMGWAMDVRMSTQSGPQVWDVRFNGERIVYELSLQDIAVFYSAHSPSMRFADYVDSVAQIGYRARTLVPGADCPPHATFLSVDHVVEGQEEPMRVEHGMCVFEHDTGVPLWRHHTRSGNNKFYAGLPDVVLIVRTIATVVNYDYIFDFIFHQNGAVEVRGISTGYILAAFRYPEAEPFGFEIRKHMTGNIHHHMFNFKVDMDINGRTNRFETISIRPVNSDNTRWSSQPGATYSQTEMHREVIQNETHATVDYNFDTPRYLTFYNKDFTTDTGIPRAYRLLMRGMSKQVNVHNFIC